MASEPDHFDMQKLYDRLCACYDEGGAICLDNYVNAYDELSKLLKLMGTVFSFVNSDVVEKVDILREYRKSEHSEQYKTIKSMIEHEVETKVTNSKKKASGSRTLLRLHRALEFIADFLKTVREAEQDEKLAGACSKSYHRTLSKHHPWLIRKGVDVAVYTLPTRRHFIEKLKITDVSAAEKLLEVTADLGMKIFAVVEQIYTDHNLHDLP